MIGVALTALLAVADDIDAGAFLVADGEQGGVVLGGFKAVGPDQPQVTRAQPGGHLAFPAAPVESAIRVADRNRPGRWGASWFLLGAPRIRCLAGGARA